MIQKMVHALFIIYNTVAFNVVSFQRVLTYVCGSYVVKFSVSNLQAELAYALNMAGSVVDVTQFLDL